MHLILYLMDFHPPLSFQPPFCYILRHVPIPQFIPSHPQTPHPTPIPLIWYLRVIPWYPLPPPPPPRNQPHLLGMIDMNTVIWIRLAVFFLVIYEAVCCLWRLRSPVLSRCPIIMKKILSPLSLVYFCIITHNSLPHRTKRESYSLRTKLFGNCLFIQQ